MVALGKLSMSDISRQKRYDTLLDTDGISPATRWVKRWSTI